MTDLDKQLAAAKKVRSIASRKYTQAQKDYMAADEAVADIMAKIKQATDDTDAGVRARETAGAALRKKTVAVLEKNPYDPYSIGGCFAHARIKGGWWSCIRVHNNLSLVPPNGQDEWDFLREYNAEQGFHYDAYESIYDLPEHVTDDWDMLPPPGEKEHDFVTITLGYQPTGMEERARVGAQVHREIILDGVRQRSTEELMKIWDQVWQEMLTKPLVRIGR